MSIRLLVIESIPTPYNLSLFAALSGRPGVVARTVFLSPNDSNRMWRVETQHHAFDHRVLPGLHAYVERIELPLYVHWGVWSEMRRFQPDVIAIGGYHYFATLEVLAFARTHHRGALLWSGSHRLSGYLKRPWVDAYKRWVISRFDSYLSYGTAARDQLMHYGAAPEHIVVGCNTVDVHYLHTCADRLRSDGTYEGPLRLLFVGRLVRTKNVHALIAAVQHLQQSGLEVTLTIVGDGRERQSLQRQVASGGVRNVSFSGFRSDEDLVKAYVNADLFVLPSFNEPWGLVVNEAAACGIPSVVSTRAGAAHDLIRDGETGFRFDPMAPGDLERTLERLAHDRQLCRRMGAAARDFILTRDQNYYADRLIEAARTALATQGKHRGRRRKP